MSQLLRFLMVGGFATFLQFATMVLLVRRFEFAPVLASAFGFCASALVNYQLNRVLTFDSRAPHRVAFPRFTAVAIIGLILNSSVMFALVNWLDIHYLAAQVVATGIVLAWNFLLSRFWTFAT